MLDTLVMATFEYRGHIVTAQPSSLDDAKWEGDLDGVSELWIVAASIETFEQSFRAAVDDIEQEEP